MADEKKPDVADPTKPAGNVEPPASTPNPSPSDESQKKIKELEEQIKERDAKLAETQTTLATIEAREREVKAVQAQKNVDADVQARIKRITENMSVDPETASAELAGLLSEVKTSAAREAVTQAMSVMQGQTTIEKLRMGVKSGNPDLDDELVDDIMAKADMLATTKQFKTAQEAIDAATKYVRGKLDTYANKKNAAPVLPAGARAEGGGANLPPEPPAPEKVKSPLEELEEHNVAKHKKLI